MLRVQEWLRGTAPVPAQLSLALVFQVNCPGCFTHALPEAAMLEREYPALHVYAVSTCFEDFDLNTLEHTRRLVEGGETVGETRHAVGPHYAWPLRNIAMDVVAPPDEATMGERVEREVNALLLQAPHLRAVPRDQLRFAVASSLRERPLEGATFAANLLQGTPSWILARDGAILDQWLGHRPTDEVRALIQRALNTSP